MRTRKLLFGLISLAANTTFLVEIAHADRRTGLAGNMLIEDPDDLFAFPQRTLQHRNMFRLDYGGDAQTGNGVLTLGNELEAFAVGVHRGDLLSPDVVGFNTELAWLGGVEGIGGPFGSTTFSDFAGPGVVDADDATTVLPSTVVDLTYARSLGGNPFGVRLGLGRGVQARKNGDDEVEKGAQTFFAAQVGYSDRPRVEPDQVVEGLRWDASGNVVFGLGNSDDVDGADENSGWSVRVAGLGRAYYPINRVVDLGFLANLSLRNEHTENAPSNDTSRDFDFGMRAGVGPAVHLPRANIAAYGGLRLGVGKNQASSTASEDDVSRLRMAVPMVNMAAEVHVLDWLYVRTGAEYGWEVRRDATDEIKERVGAGAFFWTAGLGFQHETFYFDGVVTNGFVTGGPNFIGGTEPGFLAMASMTYKFGDVFGKAPAPVTATDANRPLVVERPAPRPVEPAPAPEPPPPPPPVVDPVLAEPDQELSPPAVDAATTTKRGGSTRIGASGKATVGN